MSTACGWCCLHAIGYLLYYCTRQLQFNCITRHLQLNCKFILHLNCILFLAVKPQFSGACFSQFIPACQLQFPFCKPIAFPSLRDYRGFTVLPLDSCGPYFAVLGEVRDTAERLERTIKELVRTGVWDEVAKNLPPHRGAKTSDSGLWPTSNISIERSSLFDGWVRRDFAGLLRRLGAEPVDTQSGQSDHDIQMYVMGDTRGDKDLGSLCVKIFKARIVVAGRCKKWEEMMSRQGVSGSASQRMLHALLAMARAENKKMMKNWTPSVSAYRSRDRSKSRPGDKRPREERREEEGERGRAKKERKTEGKKAEQEEEEDAFGMQVLDVSLFKRGGKGQQRKRRKR